MPSPFPGMDPRLEAEGVFPNLHENLIVRLQEAINAVLPERYVATVKNRVWIDAEQRREPDVNVFGPDRPGGPGGGAAVATLARSGLLAVTPEPSPEPREEPYLEIVAGDGERLVTAAEVLSRSNKTPGDGGRAADQQEQIEFRLGGVNLVEIDLLRGGRHTTAASAARLRAAAGAYDYHVCVTAAGDPDRVYVAPIRLADRLPAVPVPLDPDDEPVTVDLQPPLDRSYDAGRYRRLARYGRPPDPPLTPEQQAWAEGVLRGKGLLP